MSRFGSVSPPGTNPRQWRRLGRRLPDPFPEVDGNAVRPLNLGPRYFPAMLRAIAAATRTVDVEMFLWDDDVVGRRFCDALERAALDGRRVRVLADAFGAREVIAGPLKRVADAGADVRVFNPFRFPLFRRLYHRTHKKLLVVDGVRAFAGGSGFSLYFSGWKHRERPWHDRMFEIEGPIVAQLVATFEADFGRWKQTTTPTSLPASSDAPAEPAGTARGRVLRGFPDGRDFPAELLRRVQAAEERVWIGTPYFLPPRHLRRALQRAIARGVDVRVTVPAIDGAHALLWLASRRHYGWLLKRGARVFEFGPAFYHAKIAVLDETAALVGSSNLDPLSWRRNAEMDLLFTDPETVGVVADLCLSDQSGAEEVDLETHRSRGIVSRTTEWIAGWFEDWL